MDLNFILPLEQQALVKIADTLWNTQCMKSLEICCTYGSYEIADSDDEREVDGMMSSVLLGKISNLFLPKSIKDKLVRITRNVGLQKIEHIHHVRAYDITTLPKVYHWTSCGSIDKKKTAEKLIKDETNDICGRYTLACAYCFEEDIRELSAKIPLHFKKSLDGFGNELNAFWYRTIKGDGKQKHDQTTETQNEDESWLWVVRDGDIRTYKAAYIYSLQTVNIVAAEYFFSKLTSIEYSLQERVQDCYRFLSEMLFRSSFRGNPPKDHCLDVAFFLLKQMTKDQQIEALAANPDGTLALFLDWPFQHVFFKAAEIVCPRASANNLSDLLRRILKRLNPSSPYNQKGYDYRDIFKRFWSTLPVSQKSDVINDCIAGCSSLLYDLLKARYLAGILLIVSDATTAQKHDLIHSNVGERVRLKKLLKIMHRHVFDVYGFKHKVQEMYKILC